MSLVNCKLSMEKLQGYTGIRRTWTLFGIPIFTSVQVLE